MGDRYALRAHRILTVKEPRHRVLARPVSHVTEIRRMIVIAIVVKNKMEVASATFSSLLWLIRILALPLSGESTCEVTSNIKLVIASQRLMSTNLSGKERDIIRFSPYVLIMLYSN
jgi:hypothetical protein